MKTKTESQQTRVLRVKAYLMTKPGVRCEFIRIGEATGVPKSRIDYQLSLSSDPEVLRERAKGSNGRYRIYWTYIGS